MGLLDINYKIAQQLENIEKTTNGRELEKLEQKAKALENQKRAKEIETVAIELLTDTIQTNYNKIDYNLLKNENKATIIDAVVEYIRQLKKLNFCELSEIRRILENNYFKIYCKIERIENKKTKIEKEHQNIIKQKNNIYNIEGLGGDQIFNKFKKIL